MRTQPDLGLLADRSCSCQPYQDDDGYADDEREAVEYGKAKRRRDKEELKKGQLQKQQRTTLANKRSRM